jgi:hypothetical protein
MKKKLALALCLAASATPLQPEESVDGTAWQCGRDYIIGAARYGTIYRNQTGPYHDPADVNLADTRALGAPDDFPIQKEYRWKQNKLYYRVKSCAKRKPPEEQK